MSFRFSGLRITNFKIISIFTARYIWLVNFEKRKKIYCLELHATITIYHCGCEHGVLK